jgi:exonuclease VII small subunit
MTTIIRLFSLAGLLFVAAALAACGSDSATSTQSELDAEVAEAVQIKRAGDAVHEEFVEAQDRSRICLRLAKATGTEAEESWMQALEEEAADITPAQRQALSKYEDAVQCARDAKAEIEKAGKKIAALTKDLERLKPAAVRKAAEGISP